MVTSVVFLTLKLAAERVGADSAGQVRREYVNFLTFRGESAFSECQRPPRRSASPVSLRISAPFYSEKPRFIPRRTGRDLRQTLSDAERGRAAIGASRAVGEHVLRFIAEEKKPQFLDSRPLAL